MTRVWFPGLFTEAHREAGGSDELVRELASLGYECTPDCDRVDLVFCGSVWKAAEVRRADPPIPIVHYNWDVYPFQVDHDPRTWLPYLEDLKKAVAVLVPSECTVRRTWEFANASATVVKAAIRPWDVPPAFAGAPPPHSYVLDVMRQYEDPNRGAVKLACERLGIPCIETRCARPWDEFRWLVANARLLVSAYFEASTGGLTLLEGYWHGVPCLLSDSPRHGGQDYLHDRADYFRWDDRGELESGIRRLFDGPRRVNVSEARPWITREYSQKAFARRLAAQFARFAPKQTSARSRA
jgi:glycosyltransferase involved in cell wall biosynthesis